MASYDKISSAQQVFSQISRITTLRKYSGVFQMSSLVWATAIAILWFAFRRLCREIEIRKFRKQHGCQDLPRYPHRVLGFGTDLLSDRMAALKEGRLSRLYHTHFNLNGKTFVEKIGGTITINTMAVENVRQVLALGFTGFGKDQSQIRAQWPFLGPSIFTDGPHWKFSRAMVRPLFAHAELSDMRQIQPFLDGFLNLMPTDGTRIDLQPLLHRLFLDVSMDFLFGRSLGALQVETSEESVELTQSFSNALQWAMRRKRSRWATLPPRQSKDWQESYARVHQFVDTQVRQALEKWRGQADAEAEMASDRKRYILIDELARQIKDPVELRYQILGVFLPSRETTGVLIGNAIFQLARHPYHWTRLRQIALDIGDDDLNSEKLRSLTQFKHVLYETLRTLGPSLRIVRVANRDTVLPVGGGLDRKSPVFVARHTRVSVNTWSLHHDPDVWGDDVDDFRPNRWIQRREPWHFAPFSGGPRICPAQQQALTHATYVLVRLTQRFETIRNCDPDQEFRERFLTASESRNGVVVAFNSVQGMQKREDVR